MCFSLYWHNFITTEIEWRYLWELKQKLLGKKMLKWELSIFTKEMKNRITNGLWRKVHPFLTEFLTKSVLLLMHFSIQSNLNFCNFVQVIRIAVFHSMLDHIGFEPPKMLVKIRCTHQGFTVELEDFFILFYESKKSRHTSKFKKTYIAEVDFFLNLAINQNTTCQFQSEQILFLKKNCSLLINFLE